MMPKMKSDITSNIRADFPALAQTVNGKPLCYLDSAASAQKPQVVIDAMSRVMQEHYANVHRGVYEFGNKTSTAFENARITAARFLNAASEKEIVFTRNATEAINLVAAALTPRIKAGDDIILSELEHHANIVPWWMLAHKTGAALRVVPVLKDGSLDLDHYRSLLSEKTKIVALTQMSNALGTVTPIKDMVAMARDTGAITLVDGSQGAVHLATDVQNIGADFYAMTGHKIYGPSGIGVLYGRQIALESLPPYQGGGEMIEDVSFETITFKPPPHRFEAGTPAIVEAIGLGAALDYFTAHDRSTIHAQEANLLAVAEDCLSGIEGITIYSRAQNRAAILSFNIDGVHPQDAATIFDQMGIAVRAGHHCTQPLMKALGVNATLRASFGMYNDMDDVDALVQGILKAKKILT